MLETIPTKNTRMHIVRHEGTGSSHVVVTSNGRMNLEAVSDSIIRVVYTLRDSFNVQKSLMMLPRTNQGTLQASEDQTHLILKTSKITLKIDKQTCSFSWFDSIGNLLVSETNDGANSKILHEVDVKKTVYDENVTIKTVTSVDGMKAVAEGVKQVVDRKAYNTRLRLQFQDDEAIYGLGQHEEGIFNYRGHHQYIYQQNMKIACPMFASTRGYGLLWDSYCLSSFHDDQHGTYFWTEIDDEMDFYFIYGPELDNIVSHVRTLTGKVPMLPKWAMGYFQSKERYRSQDELVEITAEFRKRKIPLDCIVLDWMSWPGNKWGQKSFDESRFPNPTKLCDDLHAMNTKFMVSIWPVMRNDGPNQIEMREKGYMLGNRATYNVWNPDARDLYWKQANEGYFKFGVDSWWADCTEPFEADWKGAVKPEPWQRVQLNTDESKKYLDPEYINAYSLLHTQGLYEGQRGQTNDKRVVILTRSASIGQQRYGSITWSGDTAATWSTLRKQIADGLNYCITGNPRWTFDIGAFFVYQKEQWFWRGDYPKGCEDEGYRELYVRWFQMGTFLPMFRSHGTDTPREPWRFGEVGSKTYDTIVKFTYLRYRLLPYLYSLLGWETHRDYTMMRALAFDFRNDPACFNIADQFMLGPSILVCPITEPMYYGPDSTELTNTKKSRQVYLPKGCDWYDFWTGKKYSGGQTIAADAPLETLPLYVRAGTILPMGPSEQYVDEKPNAALEVRIYPGSNGQFDLYQDAGDGYAYETGDYCFSLLMWNDSSRVFAIGEKNGNFKSPPCELHLVIVKEGRGTGLAESISPDAKIILGDQPADVMI